jgi:hypothetical protein
MAYEMLLLFISFGWFLSVTVIFLMYVRMRQLSNELKKVREVVNFTDQDNFGIADDTSSIHKIKI